MEKFNLNREVWLLLVRIPADLRCMHEISIATASFGKLLVWDRFKTTKVVVVVKVRIDVLKDVPISILVTGANHLGESWTWPVVIFQDNLLGGGPAKEEPVPGDGNPHLRSHEQFRHPNQNNHFIGPIPLHNANLHQDNPGPALHDQQMDDALQVNPNNEEDG